MINIVFDLDDTLYSLVPVFEKTLNTLFPDHTLNTAEFYTVFREEANKLFTDSQTGTITMDQLHRFRAQNAFKRMGITLSDSDADAFHNVYAQFKENIELSKSAQSVIEHIHKYSIPTGIITNGASEKQRKTMKHLHIDAFFEDETLIIISGEIGIDKPDRRIFDLWQTRVQNCAKTVYVGDSFSHDIVGAHNAAWHPVWYNPFGKTAPSVDFDYDEINDLRGLLSLTSIKEHLC